MIPDKIHITGYDQINDILMAETINKIISHLEEKEKEPQNVTFDGSGDKLFLESSSPQEKEDRCNQCVLEGNTGKCDKKTCSNFPPQEKEEDYIGYECPENCKERHVHMKNVAHLSFPPKKWKPEDFLEEIDRVLAIQYSGKRKGGSFEEGYTRAYENMRRFIKSLLQGL